MNISEPLKRLEEVWETRKQKGLRGWHGYGINTDGTKLMLFVEPGLNLQDLVKAAQLDTDEQESLEVFGSMQFRQMDTGNFARPSTPLRPGARVFGSGPTGVSCNGTIGGFLKLNGDGAVGSIWLLSNQHVLAGDDELPFNVEVRGAGQTLLSREVRVPDFKNRERTVDAAVARIHNDDIEDIDISYDRIQISCPNPMPSAKVGLHVQKFGNATGVTSGELIGCLPRVEVANCKDEGSTEFVNQLLFASNSDTFLAHGDSGALVISNGHPVALMFAIGEHIPEIPEQKKSFVPPFGLACPIATVLDELPHDKSQSWEILLHNPQEQHESFRAKKTCTQDHAVSAFTCQEHLQQLLQAK